LGLLVFSAEESENGEAVYKKRYGENLIGKRPNTELARKRAERFDEITKQKQKRENVIASSRIFLQRLSEFDQDSSGTINIVEFQRTLNSMYSEPDMRDHLINLFGTLDLNLDQMFKSSDLNSDGSLSYVECLQMLQNAGTSMAELMNPALPAEINDVSGYVASLFGALDIRVRAQNSRPDDHLRTIGIFTDYVGTADQLSDIEDKIYAFRQGWRAAVAYLELRNSEQ
jgi:hypothetical protein